MRRAPGDPDFQLHATHQTVIARINFLLATALVLAMAMYLVGRYVVVAPLSWIEPQWASIAAAIWLLVSLMLGVSFLANIQTRLSTFPPGVVQNIGMPGLIGQALILAGHLLIALAAYRWFSGTLTLNLLVVLLPAIVYALGVAIVLFDLRRRTALMENKP
jgi:hypothetical protein